MPRLWNDTIEAHRRDVGDAIVETAVRLVAENGLRGVTMLRIAEETGIGRATLYKYFPDVEAILRAWHQRQVAGHLDRLTAIGHQPGDAAERLEAVLDAYALMSHGSRGHLEGELEAFLHRDEEVARARKRVRDLVRDLVKEGAAAGAFRDDIAADELAAYCLHALGAAAGFSSKTAVRRLVAVTMTGLRPPT